VALHFSLPGLMSLVFAGVNVAWLLLFEEAPADRAYPQQASAGTQASLAHHSGGTHGNPPPEVGRGSRAPE
jgi:hypothetical protein